MVVGINLSGSTIYPTIAMVSKAGANAASGPSRSHLGDVRPRLLVQLAAPMPVGSLGPGHARSGGEPHGDARRGLADHMFTSGGSIFADGDQSWNWEARL
jgi:hypothetical protein